MAFLAVDKNGEEYIYAHQPSRYDDEDWCDAYVEDSCILLPQGTIEKLTGIKLTWEYEPIELK